MTELLSSFDLHDFTYFPLPTLVILLLLNQFYSYNDNKVLYLILSPLVADLIIQYDSKPSGRSIPFHNPVGVILCHVYLLWWVGLDWGPRD